MANDIGMKSIMVTSNHRPESGVSLLSHDMKSHNSAHVITRLLRSDNTC